MPPRISPPIIAELSMEALSWEVEYSRLFYEKKSLKEAGKATERDSLHGTCLVNSEELLLYPHDGAPCLASLMRGIPHKIRFSQSPAT